MISVVIPVYNNASSVEELANRIDAVLNHDTYEIVFVDDGSSDASRAKLKRIARANNNVRVIALTRNFGQHPAICAGFESVRGTTVVLMDADLQDRPEDIPQLVGRLRDGIDIVYTRKASGPENNTARASSTLYHYVFSKITGSKQFSDIGTMRAFTQKFLSALLRYDERNILYGPLMVYMGFDSAIIDVQRDARPAGKSSYTFRKRMALAVNSLISYTDIPHRLSIYIGAILFVASCIYSAVIVIQYIQYGRALPEGVTLILLLLALMMGTLMMSLGIIGSYVFRVYQEVLRRPRYLVAEKVNFQ